MTVGVNIMALCEQSLYTSNSDDYTGLDIRGILVANATMFSHLQLLSGFLCGSTHLILPYIHGI